MIYFRPKSLNVGCFNCPKPQERTEPPAYLATLFPAPFTVTILCHTHSAARTRARCWHHWPRDSLVIPIPMETYLFSSPSCAPLRRKAGIECNGNMLRSVFRQLMRTSPQGVSDTPSFRRSIAILVLVRRFCRGLELGRFVSCPLEPRCIFLATTIYSLVLSMRR